MKAFDTYLSVIKSSNKSVHTIRRYSDSASKLVAYFKLENPSDISKLTSIDYINFYNSLPLSDNSKNAVIRDLSAFFTWMEDNELLSKDNGFRKVKFGKSKFIKVNRVKKAVLTDEEAIQVIKSVKDIQVKLMLGIMWTTALRRDEIGKIKLQDIHGCKIIVNGKGGKQNVTTLDETICTLLSIYMAQRNSDSKYLFYGTRGRKSVALGYLSGVSVNNRVKKAVKECSFIPEEKIDKITAHRVRGSALTSIIREYGIEYAQRVARHSSQTTTKLYDETGDEMVETIILSRGEKSKAFLEN